MNYKLVITKKAYTGSEPEAVKELESAEPFGAVSVGDEMDWTPWGGDPKKQLKVTSVLHRIDDEMHTITVETKEETAPSYRAEEFLKFIEAVNEFNRGQARRPNVTMRRLGF